jgi:hypothetical protein
MQPGRYAESVEGNTGVIEVLTGGSPVEGSALGWCPGVAGQRTTPRGDPTAFIPSVHL